MERLGVQSSSKRWPSTRSLLLLIPLLGTAGETAAERYFFRFSGKPSSITCTETSSTIHPGLKISWNLPPDTPVQAVVTVGKSVVTDELQMPPSPSGTIEMGADTTSWTTATSFPHTIVHSMTPMVPGTKPTSSLRYDCVNGKGINFRIANAPPN